MALTNRILAALLSVSAQAGATVYYVDRVNGSDAYAGASSTAARQSLYRVSQASLAPGDSVLLKRGQVWNEQLSIPASGAADAPITFGAFGTAATQPVIDGTGVAIPSQQGLVNANKQT